MGYFFYQMMVSHEKPAAIWQKLVLALQPITVLGVTITVNFTFDS